MYRIHGSHALGTKQEVIFVVHIPMYATYAQTTLFPLRASLPYWDRLLVGNSEVFSILS
jgi:hypothetical protein